MLNGSDGRLGEELSFDTGDAQVMGEVKLHLFEIDSFEMTSGDDARGQWQRGTVLERIEEIILAGQNHGQMRFGVGFELTQGMEFSEDVETEQASLIDDDERLDFLVDEFKGRMANEPSEHGARRAYGWPVIEAAETRPDMVTPQIVAEQIINAIEPQEAVIHRG